MKDQGYLEVTEQEVAEELLSVLSKKYGEHVNRTGSQPKGIKVKVPEKLWGLKLEILRG